MSLALGCLLGVSAGAAMAQEALVLGAGGSRGLAHGGVLVGVEALGYEPEIVVGASMGAIVGALYAAGRDPGEIWALLADQDWLRLFAAPPWVVGPDREPRRPMVQFSLVGQTPRTAGGLVSGRGVNRELVRLFFDASARARADFDRLPRRFRAVTADLASGEAVVLGGGDLARAVRTSMAVPGAFAPLLHGDRLLADGGLAAYLPVAVARAVGARFVIAADVVRPAPEPEGYGSVALALRGLRLVLGNTLDPAAAPDVLIVPDIAADFAESTFPRDGTPLLRAGLAAALRDGAAGAVPRADVRPGAGARERRRPPRRLGRLVVDAPDPGLGALVAKAFRGLAPGRYAPAAVLEAVDRLYATGLFEGVWPSVEPDSGALRADGGDMAPTLVVRAEPTPRIAVAGAAGYDNDRHGRVWGGFRWRPARGPVLELALSGGWTALHRFVEGSLRRPLVGPVTGWSLGSFHGVEEIRGLRPAGAARATVRRTGGRIGLELVRPGSGLSGSVHLVGERIEQSPGPGGWAVGPVLRLESAEPTGPVGSASRLVLAARTGDLEYGAARARGVLHGAVGDLLVAGVVDGAGVWGDAPPDAVPALGDGFAMPGLRWGETRGRGRVLIGGDAAYPLAGQLFARLRLRAGAAPVRAAELRDPDHWIGGGEAALVMTTPLGDVVVGWGGNTAGGHRLRIDVGPTF